jgi:hypothetical protein
VAMFLFLEKQKYLSNVWFISPTSKLYKVSRAKNVNILSIWNGIASIYFVLKDICMFLSCV